MIRNKIYRVLHFLIASIWLINGLFCKIFDLVPRHRQIVGSIIGEEHAQYFTVMIGASEILMAGWIISGFMPRLNAIIQITVIMIMNVLEFFLVPDLLLWGKLNLVFAFLLALIIYYNEFSIKQRTEIPISR